MFSKYFSQRLIVSHVRLKLLTNIKNKSSNMKVTTEHFKKKNKK